MRVDHTAKREMGLGHVVGAEEDEAIAEADEGDGGAAPKGYVAIDLGKGFNELTHWTPSDKFRCPLY